MIRVNVDYYSGEDLYSDGDIEDELLHIVDTHTDFTQVLLNDGRWAILYHLSPVRRNLLEWLPFKSDANLLEIGAGCGALTGLFCEKLQGVVAVELSKRRAEIVATRHKEQQNLEIYVGNLTDIEFGTKFDYITLIGVLEYAGKFNKSNQTYKDFIAYVKTLLNPGGTLVVAIENKFGLKYWAGAPEDHTGKLFDSIEGYPESEGIATFSKDELTDILGSQFDDVRYYYPYPDYKLPQQMFSDEYQPRLGQLSGYTPNYDQDRFRLFSEQLAIDNIISSNKFAFFANSFLVICKNLG
jgi:2-polyprenyl-3-methyl-5-hydroxy-6-metoxy-1,4-benzoquinol methylase